MRACLSVCVLMLAVATVVADAPTAEKTETISVFGEGTLKVPASFKKAPLKSRIIAAEFKASAGEGDDVKTARVYSMASGGGVQPNIARWKGQFSESPDGAFKQEKMEIGTWKVYLVDHAGKFADSMGGGPFAPGKKVLREDWAMTGAILESKEGRLYFVKMIGPGEVVKANRDDFVKMIKSIGE